MIKESECCSKLIEEEFEAIVMTKKDHGDFESSTEGCICKKEDEERDVNVPNHDHFPEKHRGSTHQHCNLNLSLIKKVPVS